jgi:hypothetical protein
VVEPSLTNENVLVVGGSDNDTAQFHEDTGQSASFPVSRHLSNLSHSQIQQSMVLVLMSLSGITEAICWRQFKCFPNMMTGHTVKVLDAVAGWQWKDALWGTIMILSYFLGGTMYKMIHLLQQEQQSKQHPSRLQSSVIPNTLTAVARWVVLWFSASDLVAMRLSAAHVLWRLPLLSIGFGMINSVTIDIWGAITNAVTGHWTKISTGLAEAILLGPKGVGQVAKTSTTCMGVFAISLVITSGILQGFGNIGVGDSFVGIGSNSRVSSILWKRLPPLGITLGVIYGVLFNGYARYYQRYYSEQDKG